MSAVKVLCCPVRHQFAPIKAPLHLKRLRALERHSGILVVQKDIKQGDTRAQKAPQQVSGCP